MTERRKRILGMTGGQLIVLVCLGLTAIGVMGLVGKFVLAGSPQLPALAIQSTQAVQPVSSPESTQTRQPTWTPVPPSPTFTATSYESLIPEGWKQHEYGDIEIWLPEEFANGKAEEALLALERNKGSGNDFNVGVYLYKDEGVTSDVDDYIRAGLGHFASDTTFLEKKAFQIGTFDVRRVKYQYFYLGIPIGMVDYLIKDGSTVWVISCRAYYSELADWLPIFDQIAHTFRISG
jgi:hypothetical protein